MPTETWEDGYGVAWQHMHHPKLEKSDAEVTVQAFEEVWIENGWEAGRSEASAPPEGVVLTGNKSVPDGEPAVTSPDAPEPVTEPTGKGRK